MNKAILLVVVIALLVMGWSALRDQETGQGEVVRTPTPTAITQAPEGWQTYRSERLGFTVAHPPEMQVRENEQGEVVFFMAGPTQREGTEVYDGMMVSVLRQTYQGDFREFVKAQRQEIVDQPINAQVGEITTLTIEGRQGYEFTVDSLGQFTHLYVPNNDNEYIRIIYLVEDPTGQGFEQTLNQMVQTVELEQ